MSDILADLKALHFNWEHGSTINDSAIFGRAIHEIERLRATIDQLRAVAGAVSLESGLTFSSIKQEIKNGSSVQT